MDALLAGSYSWLMYFVVPLISTVLVFYPILQVAKRKNLMDTPDERKQQKSPVPVLGGIAVFFGIIVGMMFLNLQLAGSSLFPMVSAMVVMLYIGFIDDIINIKPSVRLIMEMLVAFVLILGMKSYICNFQGLWGVQKLSALIGIPLSIVTFVGVVNAINMVDGIDGLSSSLCILIIGCLGYLLHLCGNHAFSALAIMEIGALLPFFLHNVFGSATKMFIGDSGTMMVGTSISAMLMSILGNEQTLHELHPQLDFSLIAFCLAVLSIPVADTLRVMFCRILNHRSPFSPDQTHLHHLFIKLGFSYISVTCSELLLDIAVIGTFFLSWTLGASVDLQLYITIAAAALADFGVAALLAVANRKQDKVCIVLQKVASHSHLEEKKFWKVTQNLVDRKYRK